MLSQHKGTYQSSTNLNATNRIETDQDLLDNTKNGNIAISKEGKIVKGWQSYESYLSSKGKITVKESEVVIFGPDVIADTSSKNIRCGIYKITNIITQDSYIGSSVNVKQRKNKHFSDLNLNKHFSLHLQRSYNKHGKQNFNFEILAKAPKEYLIKLEQWFLDKLKPTFNKKTGSYVLPVFLHDR
jgi:hypothetical protein